MVSHRPLSGPRSRYNFDFQGQGLADTGECEALGIIDAFTKTVIVLPLPDRTATTLVPPLMDAVHFTRGHPEVFHSDAAPEFMGEVVKQVADITHTTLTTTLGHNAQGNAEIEQWWRFWNRCMRLLSPSMYRNWPLYAQRICWAYNTAVQETLGDISPFELDHGTPPKSPFAPSLFPLTNNDANDLDIELIDQGDYAANLRTSTDAFVRLAAAHRDYMQQTTQDRLNKNGVPATFAIGDRVKIYVPPTQTQLDATGRRASHITAWRGPCTISAVLPPPQTGYSMIEDRTNRTFHRTIINIRPYRATRDAPLPHHDLLADGPLLANQLIAIRDTPDSRFSIAKVLTNTETHLTVHYFGATNPRLDRATSKPAWTRPDTRIAMHPTRPSPQHTAYTGIINTADIPDLLLASKIALRANRTLRSTCAQALFHLRDQMLVY